jgi:hypothetical protein
MMKTIEEEAEQHWSMTYMMAKDESIKPYVVNDFIAGANSNWVKAEIIREKMSLISNLRCSYDDTYYMDLEYDRLAQQLKQLEDERDNNTSDE